MGDRESRRFRAPDPVNGAARTTNRLAAGSRESNPQPPSAPRLGMSAGQGTRCGPTELGPCPPQVVADGLGVVDDEVVEHFAPAQPCLLKTLGDFGNRELQPREQLPQAREELADLAATAIVARYVTAEANEWFAVPFRVIEEAVSLIESDAVVN